MSGILKFFTDKGYQTFRTVGNRSEPNRGALICPYDILLPFQIKRDKSTNPISHIKLIDADDDSILRDITDLDDVYMAKGALFDWLYYKAETLLSPDISTYVDRNVYIDFHDGKTNWFSEVFTVGRIQSGGGGPDPLEDCESYILIEAGGGCMIGDLYTGTGYEEKFYVFGDIGLAEYTYTSDENEDGHGNRESLFERVEKREFLTVYVTKNAVDGLALLPLFPTVTITDRFGNSFNAEHIETEVNWQGHDFALVTLSWLAANHLLLNCCEEEYDHYIFESPIWTPSGD